MPVILHVEDERVVRILYKEVFEERGHKIVQARSGEEALRLLKTMAPDVIILDLKMPGIGGKGFLKEFKARKLKIPVVISSAYPWPPDSYTSSSADAYVVKSGNLEGLVHEVEGILDKPRDN